jgi:hypothetical protein
MEYSTTIEDDFLKFTDRWNDELLVELNSQGRIEVSVRGTYVLLEKPQVLDLIQNLIKHIADVEGGITC